MSSSVINVGRVGHGRIQPRAILAHALAQRAGKIRLAVVADARRLGRRDVAGVDDAQRTVDGIAAGMACRRRPACDRPDSRRRWPASGRARAGARRPRPAPAPARRRRPAPATAPRQAGPGARARGTRIGNDMRGAAAGIMRRHPSAWRWPPRPSGPGRPCSRCCSPRWPRASRRRPAARDCRGRARGSRHSPPSPWDWRP